MQISDYISRSMAITQLEILHMPRKMEILVNYGSRFQIWSQISHISNIFVDIRVPIFN